MPIFPDNQKAEISRITIQGHPRQKVRETPSKSISSGLVICAFHSRYTGGINKRIIVTSSPGKKKNQKSKKGWGHGSSGRAYA
jgi:hypothetical protein